MIAGAIQQKLKSLPVFFICISTILFKGIFFSTKFKSENWPPAIPVCPEDSEINFISFVLILLSTLKFLSLKISKAIVKELPAVIAVDSEFFMS